jgi:hypothetical protein
MADASLVDHQDADVIPGRQHLEVAQTDGLSLFHDVVSDRLHELIARRHVPADAANVRFDQ